MLNHRRMISLLLCLGLILALLAGCGASETAAPDASAPGSEAEASASAPEAAAAPEAEAEPEAVSAAEPAEASTAEPEEEPEPEPVPEISYPLVEETETLTLWTMFPPPMANAMNNDVSQMYCYQVAKEVTNIKLDVTVVPFESAAEQFSLNSAAHSWTDLILGVNSYMSSMEAAVEDEIIIDLADYLEEFAPAYWKVLQDTPDFKKEITLDSGIIPAFYGMNDTSTIVSGPQIRKDFLDAVNLPIPETLSDLETVLLAFKDELGIKYPIYSSLTIYSPVITNAYEGSSAYGSSGFYVDENGTVQCVWLCDDYREMVELMHDWYGKELITSDSITLTGEESAIQGSLTAVWGDNIKTMSHTSEEATTDPNCDIVAMSYPTKEAGGTAYVALSDYAADPFSVSTNCADPELAIMYVNFFYTPEGQMACNYGIEGDSYVYNENGEPEFTDKVMNNPDGLDVSVAQGIYSSFFMPYVHLPSRTASAYTDQDEFDASDIWKQHVDNSHTYKGDLTITESEAYAAVMSDIETYVDETTPKFINGDLSFDQWDDFMKTIQDMGIEDARVLKQAAYDRYLQR